MKEYGGCATTAWHEKKILNIYIYFFSSPYSGILNLFINSSWDPLQHI